MKTPSKDYTQDSTGQWWFKSPTRGNRMRVPVRTCQQCGIEFIERHPQKFCSVGCRVDSTRGVLRVERTERPCAWCGELFKPRKASQSARCCSRRCGYDLGNSKRGRKGEQNANWKGGTKNHNRGYLMVYVLGRGMQLQHRVVMEEILGRQLVKGETVHHKNGIRNDNRPENLELWIKTQPPGQRANEKQHCETCTCFKNH